jgi:putative oxidoreductase
MNSTTTLNSTGINSTTDSLQDTLALVGRILLAYLFVPSGLDKLTNFAGTVGYISSTGLPLPEVCAAIAVAVELGLGLLLLAGWQTRWVALAMAIFVLVITPIFHHYWSVPAAEMAGQKLNFDKNLAILGGLLAFAAFGAGRFGVDGRRRV